MKMMNDDQLSYTTNIVLSLCIIAVSACSMRGSGQEGVMWGGTLGGVQGPSQQVWPVPRGAGPRLGEGQGRKEKTGKATVTTTLQNPA